MQGAQQCSAVLCNSSAKAGLACRGKRGNMGHLSNPNAGASYWKDRRMGRVFLGETGTFLMGDSQNRSSSQIRLCVYCVRCVIYDIIYDITTYPITFYRTWVPARFHCGTAFAKEHKESHDVLEHREIPTATCFGDAHQKLVLEVFWAWDLRWNSPM